MFKKYYKEANDDIKTNRELIGKIFEEAEKTVVTNKKAKIYRFGMVAAAALVLAVSLPFISGIVKNTNSDGVTQPGTAIAYTDKTEKNEQTPVIGGEGASSAETSKSTEQMQENTVPAMENNGAGTPEVVKPIEPIVENNSRPSDGSPILAMETGETQTFEIPRGRMGAETEGEAEIREYSVPIGEWEEVSEEEMRVVAGFFFDKYGESDETTGFAYGFYTAGKTAVEEQNVYHVRMSWLVDNNHWSLIQDFVINESMSELYYSELADGENVCWNTSNNILDM